MLLKLGALGLAVWGHFAAYEVMFWSMVSVLYLMSYIDRMERRRVAEKRKGGV